MANALAALANWLSDGNARLLSLDHPPRLYSARPFHSMPYHLQHTQLRVLHKYVMQQRNRATLSASRIILLEQKRARRFKSVADELVKKAREAMLTAVQVFNNPQIDFMSELFIVTNVIAFNLGPKWKAPGIGTSRG